MSHPDDLIAAAYDAKLSPYAPHAGAIAKGLVDVKEHQRHTQSGKVVTVHQHTMRVDKRALVDMLAQHLGGHDQLPDHAGLHAAIDRALDQHHETGGRVKHVRYENGQWRTSNTKPQAEAGQPMLHVGGGKVKASVGGELKGHVAIAQGEAPPPDQPKQAEPEPAKPAPDTAGDRGGKVKPLEIVAMHYSDKSRAMVKLPGAQAQRAYNEGLLVANTPRAYEVKGSAFDRSITGADFELDPAKTYYVVIKHGQQLPAWIDGELPTVGVGKLVHDVIYGGKATPGIRYDGPTITERAGDQAAAIAKPTEQVGKPPIPVEPAGGWKEFVDQDEDYVNPADGKRPKVGVNQAVGRFWRDDMGRGWPGDDDGKTKGTWIQATMAWAVEHGYNPDDPQIVSAIRYQYPPEAGKGDEAEQAYRHKFYAEAIAAKAAEQERFGIDANHLESVIAAIGGNDNVNDPTNPINKPLHFARDLDRLHAQLFDAQRKLRGERMKGLHSDEAFDRMIVNNQRARAAIELISKLARGNHLGYAQNVARLARNPLTRQERQALVRAVAELGHRHGTDIADHLRSNGDKDLCKKLGLEWREPGADTIKRIMTKHKQLFDAYRQMLDGEKALEDETKALGVEARRLRDVVYNTMNGGQYAAIKARDEARETWDTKAAELERHRSRRKTMREDMEFGILYAEVRRPSPTAMVNTPTELRAKVVAMDKDNNVLPGADDGMVARGIEAFGYLVGNSHVGLDHPITFAINPDFTRANYAYQGRADDSVQMTLGTPTATIVHELGHYFEHRAGDGFVQRAAIDFLFERTGDKPLVSLKDIRPDHGYRDHEVCKPDGFMDPYIGKFYTPNGLKVEQTTTTEIMSMGIEQLHRDAALFFLKDPGHAAFVLDMLRSGGR